MIGLGRSAARQEPARELPACDACGSSGQPTETIRPQGIEVVVCVAYAPCIATCKANGTWKQT